MALYEPQAGLLAAERCIVAHVTAALQCGAEVHGHETVVNWETGDAGVRVRTNRGVYQAERLVLTAGAWTHRLLTRYHGVLQPERQVLIWMQPRVPSAFQMDVFPVFILDVEEGHFYGMPTYGIPGFKIGRFHHLEQLVDDPATVDRGFHPEDEALLRGLVQRYFPDGDGPILSTATCMFTNSPDAHFVIDAHPDDPRVVFAGGFSGHGYKFCSVIGEILADLAEDGATRHDISLFNTARLAPSAIER